MSDFHRWTTDKESEAAMRRSSQKFFEENPQIIRRAAQKLADDVDKWAIEQSRKKDK